jgi:hypothetical protein
MNKLTFVTTLFTLAITLVVLSVSSSSAQVLNYVLQPGSYIRPDFGTFTDEPLTGSFQWIFQGTNRNGNGIFQLVSLSFTSASFSITLDPNPSTPDSDIDLLQSYPTRVGAVAGIVDLNGFTSPPPLLGYSTEPSPAMLAVGGLYNGPDYAPTSFSTGDEPAIGPINGGLLIASLNLNVALVPEPSALTLLALGGFVALAARRR